MKCTVEPFNESTAVGLSLDKVSSFCLPVSLSITKCNNWIAEESLVDQYNIDSGAFGLNEGILLVIAWIEPLKSPSAGKPLNSNSVLSKLISFKSA